MPSLWRMLIGMLGGLGVGDVVILLVSPHIATQVHAAQRASVQPLYLLLALLCVAVVIVTDAWSLLVLARVFEPGIGRRPVIATALNSAPHRRRHLVRRVRDPVPDLHAAPRWPHGFAVGLGGHPERAGAHPVARGGGPDLAACPGQAHPSPPCSAGCCYPPQGCFWACGWWSGCGCGVPSAVLVPERLHGKLDELHRGGAPFGGAPADDRRAIALQLRVWVACCLFSFACARPDHARLYCAHDRRAGA